MDAQCLNLHNQVAQLAEGMAENRSEHKSFRRRLDELEEAGRRQNEILVTLQRQADAIEAMGERIENLAGSLNRVAGRVADMEREPGERWKKISFEIIKYLVMAALGAALGLMMK